MCRKYIELQYKFVWFWYILNLRVIKKTGYVFTHFLFNLWIYFIIGFSPIIWLTYINTFKLRKHCNTKYRMYVSNAFLLPFLRIMMTNISRRKRKCHKLSFYRISSLLSVKRGLAKTVVNDKKKNVSTPASVVIEAETGSAFLCFSALARTCCRVP